MNDITGPKIRTLRDVQSDLWHARDHAEMLRRQYEHAKAKADALIAEAAALARYDIEYIDTDGDRPRVDRALRQVRKAFPKVWTSKRTGRNPWSGEVLDEVLYIDFEMGTGIGRALADALAAQGVAVFWDGREGCAVTVAPSRSRIHIRESYRGDTVTVEHGYAEARRGEYTDPSGMWAATR